MDIFVVGFEQQMVRDMYKGTKHLNFVYQEQRLGTGHAVMVTRELFEKVDHCDVMVLYGDTPLLKPSTMQKLIERHRHQDAAATILTTVTENPSGYGRVLRNPDNTVLSIVEDKDANIYEKKINEINTGTYCFDSEQLFHALEFIRPSNAPSEYYLTDVIHVLVKEDKRVEVFVTPDPSEALGVNNRVQLATAEKILRKRILEELMIAGVTVLDPDNTFIDDGVKIGQDTIIEPYSILQGKTVVGQGCHIGPGAHLVSCKVGDSAKIYHSVLEQQKVPKGAVIGPFVHERKEEGSV